MKHVIRVVHCIRFWNIFG